MAIERILGTDTGKAAFEKADRNFVGLGATVDSLAVYPVTSLTNANSLPNGRAAGISLTNGPTISVYYYDTYVSGGYGWQNARQQSDPSNLYTRGVLGGTWTAWQKIATDKQPSWINATLQNGWTGSVTYRKNALGYVEIGITAAASVIAPHTIVATLPVGFRPNPGIPRIPISITESLTGNTRYLYIDSPSGGILISGDSVLTPGAIYSTQIIAYYGE